MLARLGLISVIMLSLKMTTRWSSQLYWSHFLEDDHDGLYAQDQCWKAKIGILSRHGERWLPYHVPLV